MTLSIIMASRVLVNSGAFSSPCGQPHRAQLLKQRLRKTAMTTWRKMTPATMKMVKKMQSGWHLPPPLPLFLSTVHNRVEVLHLSLHPAPPLIHIHLHVLKLRERRLNIYLITTNLSVSKWDALSIS